MRKLRPRISKIISWPVIPALTAVSSRGYNLVKKGESILAYKLRLAGFSQRSATLGDGEVSYWIGGKGKPVLLLHGIGPPGIWQWHEQVYALAGQYRVIMPDLLWFGGSHSTVPDYSIGHQVRTMRALLRHLSVKKAHMAAISYGGFVGYELAAAYPELVDKAIICDSPCRAYTRADYDNLCVRLEIDSIADLMIPKSREALQKMVDAASYQKTRLPDFALDDTLAHMFSSFADEQVQLVEWLVENGERVKERPATMTAQTLIIWGRHDQLFPLALGERLAESMGDLARLVIIERAGHGPNLEHPRQVNRLILDFLS